MNNIGFRYGDVRDQFVTRVREFLSGEGSRKSNKARSQASKNNSLPKFARGDDDTENVFGFNTPAIGSGFEVQQNESKKHKTDKADPELKLRKADRELVEKAIKAAADKNFGNKDITPERYQQLYEHSEGYRKRVDRGYGKEDAYYNLPRKLDKMPMARTVWRDVESETGNNGSFYNPNTNTAYLSPASFDRDVVGGKDHLKLHEWNHKLYNPEYGFSGNVPLQRYKYLQPAANRTKFLNWQDNLAREFTGDPTSRTKEDHDENWYEGGADASAVRYLLYKAGVFNTMDPESKISSEELGKFYEQYLKENPENPYLRFIENYGVDNGAYLLNNTAALNKKFQQDDGRILAKRGKDSKFRYLRFNRR